MTETDGVNNPDYKTHDLQDWPIDRLIEYARNPRKNDHAVDRVAAAIREFGFKVPVVARSDGTLVDGHLRLKAAKKLGMDTVPVLLADDLTDAQVKAFRISVNRMAELAEWDDELLRVEFEELDAMGFNLELTGFTPDELGDVFDPGEQEEDQDDSLSENYSRKIEAPIYEITGEKPSIADMVDTSKADELKDEISKADLPDDVREFLNHAADRHTVFNFRNIAEFYAHADADVQHLMERSALVIIDFDKAIENGFVKLTEKIAEQYAKDYLEHA